MFDSSFSIYLRSFIARTVGNGNTIDVNGSLNDRTISPECFTHRQRE
jgi:hypothetical protein